MPKASGQATPNVKVRVNPLGALVCLLGFYYVTHSLLGPEFARAFARLDWGVLLFSPVLLGVAWSLFAKRRRALVAQAEGRPVAELLGTTLIGRMLDECSLARRGGIFASYLVAKREKLPFLRIIALYGFELLADVFTLCAFGLTVLSLAEGEAAERMAWLVAFGLGAALSGLGLLRVLLGRGELSLVSTLLLRLLPPGFGEPLTQTFVQARELAPALRRAGLWLRFTLYGLAYLAAYCAFFAVLGAALRLDLDWTLMPLLAGALLLGDFLPALPSRIGLSEALLFAILKSQDLPTAEALLFAVCGHALLLLVAALSGFVNLVWQRGGTGSE